MKGAFEGGISAVASGNGIHLSSRLLVSGWAS